jgi:hypothetical protein
LPVFPFPAYLLSSPSVVQAGLACCVSLLSSRSGFSHCDTLSTTSLLFVREAWHFTPQTATIYFFFATPDSFKHSSVTPPPSVRPRGRTSRSQHQYSPQIPPLNRSSAESLEIFLRNPFFLRGSIKSFSPPILQDNQEDCVSYLSACRGAIALQHAAPAEREALWSNGMLLPLFTAISDGRVILTWLV